LKETAAPGIIGFPPFHPWFGSRPGLKTPGIFRENPRIRPGPLSKQSELEIRRFKMRKRITAIAALSLFTAVFLAASSSAQTQTQTQDQEKPALAAGARLRDALNLTPEQEAKLKVYREARQKESQEFRDEMRKMQTELHDLTDDPKADQKKIDGLIDEMFKLRADRQKASFRNRAEWKNIFTPEQLEKMQNVRGRLGRLADIQGMRLGRALGRGGLGLGVGRLQGLRPMGRALGPGRGWMMRRPGRGLRWRW